MLSCTICKFDSFSYGHEFLFQTYLYHLVRKDHRHNFSPYFYYIYLNYDETVSKIMGMLAFLPQIVLVFFLGIRYAHDLPMAFFLQTFAFVMLNKVITSQVHKLI